jgi:hypothetical protein
MLFRIIFFSIIFYFIFKVIRWFININNIINNQRKENNKPENNKKTYTKDEIQDAEYEEIK